MGSKDPEEVIAAFIRLMPERECHEFGLWAAEQVRDLMPDDRSKRALDVKRLWLDGKATDEELDAAWDAAWDAAGGAAEAAAWAAARAAAWAGAGAAAWDAARDAAWGAAEAAAWAAARAAARATAWAAAWDAAGAAAGAAARKLQENWILENHKDRLHQAWVYEVMTKE